MIKFNQKQLNLIHQEIQILIAFNDTTDNQEILALNVKRLEDLVNLSIKSWRAKNELTIALITKV